MTFTCKDAVCISKFIVWVSALGAQFLPCTVWAQATKSVVEPSVPAYGSMLLNMVISLAIVCILAFVLLKWGLKRLADRQTEGSDIYVLSRVAIEPRRSLLVVKVASKTLLLSSSESGISFIQELDAQDASVFAHSSTAPKKKSFSLELLTHEDKLEFDKLEFRDKD